METLNPAGYLLFEGLDLTALACPLEGHWIELKPGETLFTEGQPAGCYYFFESGKLEITRMIEGQKMVIQTFGPGMSGGELPLLSGTTHLGTGVVLEPGRVFCLSETSFWNLMGCSPDFRAHILVDMAERMQGYHTLSLQREKLISLGTMSAGLAHELNNPAAAAARAAEAMGRTLDAFDESSSRILEPFIFNVHDAAGYPFEPIRAALKPAGQALPTLERNRREEELATWLEAIGLPDPWGLAPTLVSVGLEKGLLETFSTRLVPAQVANFIGWVARDAELRMLAYELGESTARISRLVGAIKNYAHMDKSLEKAPVDLARGLDDTALILGWKLRRKNVRLEREYMEAMPQFCGYGGELNQVWTNLLDNAIDALPEKGGVISLHTGTAEDGKAVFISIADNGSGIPADVKAHIFEPFYTTKGVGEGTGLGLDVAHRIIAAHGGEIDVESEPGRTVFTVRLPLG